MAARDTIKQHTDTRTEWIRKPTGQSEMRRHRGSRMTLFQLDHVLDRAGRIVEHVDLLLSAKRTHDGF